MLPLLIAAVALQAGSQIYAGSQADRAARDQANLINDQGLLMREEAYAEAARIRDEGYRFSQEQIMDYISSGVEMYGTPLLVANETVSMSKYDAAMTEKKGNAEYSFAQRKAQIVKNEGRAALVGSIMGAGSTVLKGTNAGMFDSSQAGSWSPGRIESYVSGGK